MNFDNFGGLAGHYWVCEDHIKQMKVGRRGKDGRAFARGAMQYLRVILASLHGEGLPSDSTDVTNKELADLWEHCAYLQTIKCAPGAARSNPTGGMIRNCPSFLLQPELGIIQPQIVVLLGRSNLRDVVRPWAVSEDGYGKEQGPHLERDTATIDGRSVELISLNHPSARSKDVISSREQLVASLGLARAILKQAGLQ
ncbi:MAG TPA: uracil-DNA glycosylase family protein [Solirubrobacterales bacterium]|nr:uracil-DNA glycosylase family protein [Solirubrobacterales bacterium]